MSFPFDRVTHLLVDLDGVLFRGHTMLPGADTFIRWLHEHHIALRLVTNNATRTPQENAQHLLRMGIPAQADEVFTSAMATALYLQERHLTRKPAFVVGEDGLRAALEGVGVRLVTEGAELVVAGLDRQLTYHILAIATLAIERGAIFVGTNPDVNLPSEDGLLPGAGAILAALQAATGVQPVVIGKPNPVMLELAMKQLGSTVQNTAMLGDRLDTDIAAAEAAGMPSILVLTGVSKEEDIARTGIQPTLVVQNLADLMQEWEQALT